ncbi:MAG: hypothetical protein MUO68_07770 [Desulfobacteraceae bacterium]|nr:hypothetical protein [Desulfobacteraceae bacterium]
MDDLHQLIIFVDSDGNLNELIPLWLECGINYVWPLEVEAGKDAIKEEVMAKVPFLLEKGGYFPSVDHLVPPDVSLGNYQYYINTMRKVAGLEKISLS